MASHCITLLRTQRVVPGRLLLLALIGVAGSASAQVSLTALDSAYTQSFDTLPATGSATWTNNSTVSGWYHARTGTGTTIVAEIGSSNAGNLYSYGLAGASDRAFGSVGSSNAAVGNLYWGARLKNNTGATITSLDVAYNGEQWRNSAAAAQTVVFSYLIGNPAVVGSLAEFQAAGTAVASLDFSSPITAGSAGPLNGNLAANRSARTFTITGLSIPSGSEVMLRWFDPDHSGADHGLAIDDVSVTPHGETAGPAGLSISNASASEGQAGTTSFDFTVELSEPAAAGGVSFDITTTNGTALAGSDYIAKTLTAQTIPEGGNSYTFSVLVNGDTEAEPDETFTVDISNVTGVVVLEGQGLGTITNDDFGAASHKIHDIQGSTAASPIPAGTVVTVEGVVTASFQAAGKLSGFFLQEEDADGDADPLTSEGTFVFCAACPTVVAEGQRVRVSGTVSEYFTMTQINATTAAAVAITEAGNHLADITPATIVLPVTGSIDDYYEPREGMLVRYTDALTVSEYFELNRYGQIELYQGGRPRQFTEVSAASVAGLTAHLDGLERRRVIMDDENNIQNDIINLVDGSQFAYYPRSRGGLSIGTQGADFFRGGDIVNNLTGVLHHSFAGLTGTDAWRIRPTLAAPASFTVANPRPATAPQVGGTIKVASANLLNYFTTIDTTSSTSSGPCGPSGGQDCRGADSVAELDRQRERTSIVLCGLNADVVGLTELENGSSNAAITDLLGAVNARCGGSHPYAAASNNGALGSDAIRGQLIYRTGVVAPFGSALFDMNAAHNRPPIAQAFDVVDTNNPAFSERFSVVVSHFKSKSCSSASGSDADSGNGEGCYSARRAGQATRLLTWVNVTVIPAAGGDTDVLLVGDFNSYAKEAPITTLTAAAAGYSDLLSSLPEAEAYSYLFDGQLGHLDYVLASASISDKVTGVNAWHINADEIPLFDYNDEIRDVGEPDYDKKPNGSLLSPVRSVYEPNSPYRASDHDPVLIGLFADPESIFRDGFDR